jgi:hypothetical protein
MDVCPVLSSVWVQRSPQTSQESGWFSQCMLPNLHYRPSGATQLTSNVLVPRYIPRHLCSPVLSVVDGHWPGAVRAAVPEAPINEEHNPTASPREIRTSE